MLSQKKIKYIRPGREAIRRVKDKICEETSIYGNYHDDFKAYIPNNDIIIIKEFNFNDLEKDEWNNVSFVFKMPENSWYNRHNWFTIDVAEDGHCIMNMCEGFAFIDNLYIEEVDFCNSEGDECSPTDGEILATSPHRKNNNYLNMYVSNLDNVYSATNIKIRAIQGGTVRVLPDRYCETGIKEINWNTKSAYGSQVAEGIYIWEMDLENDCGIQKYVTKFYKPSSDDIIQSLDETIYPCNSSVQTPLACCESEPDIFIENKIILGNAPIKYQAINNIIIANTTVKASAKNVIFKAGNSVAINSETTIEAGAGVDIIIEPCDNAVNQKRIEVIKDTIIIDTLCFDKENKTKFSKKTKVKTNTLSVYPNPAQNELSIKLDFAEQQNTTEISIYDIFGRQVYSKQIMGIKNTTQKVNTANFANGIYLVKINSGTIQKTQKIIIQK